MPPEIARLRAQLEQHRRALWQLDVIEAAEHLVRGHHRRLLEQELAELHEDDARARRILARARTGNDLPFIVATEEYLCRVRRRTEFVRRQARELDVASAKARTTYTTERQHMLELVSGLQRLLARIVRPAL